MGEEVDVASYDPTFNLVYATHALLQHQAGMGLNAAGR